MISTTFLILCIALSAGLSESKEEYGLFRQRRRRILASTQAPSQKPSPQPTLPLTAAPSSFPSPSAPTHFPSAFPAPSPPPFKNAFLPTGQNAYGNTNATIGPWPECVGWACEDCRSYISTVAEGNPSTRCVSGEGIVHRIVVLTNQNGVVIAVPMRG